MRDAGSPRGGGLFLVQEPRGTAGRCVSGAAETLAQQKDWRGAAGYLQRYLQLNPANVDARIKLADAISTFAPEQHERLVTLRRELVGLAQDRPDLHLKLAQELLATNQFAEAGNEAERAVDPKNMEQTHSAQRIVAAAYFAQVQVNPNDKTLIRTAAKKLAGLVADNPGDATIADCTAEFYRRFPKDAGLENATAKADEIITAMVAANPQDPQALLTSFDYRKRHDLKNARDDLDALLRQDPDNVEALLRAAREDRTAKTSDGWQSAVAHLKHAIAVAPKDSRGYTLLGDTYIKSGKRDDALEVLSQGRSQIGSMDFDLNQMMVVLLVAANRVDEGQTIVKEMRAEYIRTLPRLSSIRRQQEDNLIRLLNARCRIASGELRQAVPDLEAILLGSEKSGGDATMRSARLDALILLAETYTALNQLDLAAHYWDGVASEQPTNAEAPLKAAACYLKLGRSGEAIERLDGLVSSDSAPPEARIVLVQAHLQQQMGLPADKRDWTAFLSQLKAAHEKFPGRWEWDIAGAAYLVSLPDGKAKQQAFERLRALESTSPEKAEPWSKLAFLYNACGSQEDVQRALHEFDQREPNAVRRTLVRAGLLRLRGQTKAAIELLEKAGGSAGPGDGSLLEVARLQLLVATNDLEGARPGSGRIGRCLRWRVAILGTRL